MAIPEHKLLDSIELIYDAAIDPALWQVTMERVTQAVDAQAATFCVIENDSNFVAFNLFNFDAAMLSEYLRDMAQIDPTVQAIAAQPHRKLFHDSELISERQKDRHAYYGWQHRFSDMRHRIAGMARPMPTIRAGITVHRARNHGDFGNESKRRFALLFEHIERALDISFRLGTFGNLQTTLLAVLDRMPVAMVIFDDRARVVLANRRASEFAAANDGLTMTADGLFLQRAADQRKLQNLIRGVLRCRSRPTAPPSGVMLAPRPSGRWPYSITVSPLGSNSLHVATVRPAGCIVIADPAQAPDLATERLRKLYGLTDSEARLAANLTDGRDVKSAAAAIGIAYSTARVQLSSIFRKTETKRQAQLIRLLNVSLPLLHDPALH